LPLRPTKLRTFLVKQLKVSNPEALFLLAEQRVLLNGSIANGSDVVTEKDEIIVDEKVIQQKKKFTYIKFYKPRGIESTLNKNIQDNLTTVFDYPTKLFPIGRLDKESEGLMIFTDDGKWYKEITNPTNEKEKEYLVTVDKPMTEEFIEAMQNGIVIMGKKTKPAIAEPLLPTLNLELLTFKLTLTEGMNRQIRRMCYKLGYEVTSLKRLRIATIELGNLKPGEWEEIIL
jgi:23S rRNA pseudouridine2604 synthase